MNDKFDGETARNGAYSLPAEISIHLKIKHEDKQLEIARRMTPPGWLRGRLDSNGTNLTRLK